MAAAPKSKHQRKITGNISAWKKRRAKRFRTNMNPNHDEKGQFASAPSSIQHGGETYHATGRTGTHDSGETSHEYESGSGGVEWRTLSQLTGAVPKPAAAKKDYKAASDELEKHYQPIGTGKVDVSKVQDKSTHILDSLPPSQRNEIVERNRQIYTRHGSISEMVKIPLSKIRPNQRGEDRINDSSKGSAETIRNGDLSKIAKGDIAPILITKGKGGKYDMIDGNHRYSAAEMNGQKHIYALVVTRPVSNSRSLRKGSGSISLRKQRRRKLGTNNARPINPLKIDPTRTITLRRQMATKVKQQFGRLKAAILQLVEKEDAFGLVEREPLKFNAFCPTGPGGGTDPSCSPAHATREINDQEREKALSQVIDRMGEIEDEGSDQTTGLKEHRGLDVMAKALSGKRGEPVIAHDASGKVIAAGSMSISPANPQRASVEYIGSVQKGGGSAVMKHLLDKAKAAGVKEVTADASADAIPLNKKFGFEVVGTHGPNGTPMRLTQNANPNHDEHGRFASGGGDLSKAEKLPRPKVPLQQKGPYIKAPFSQELDPALRDKAAKVVMSGRVKSEQVELSSLTAMQDAVSKKTVEYMMKESGKPENKHLREPIVVVRMEGKDYLYDGTHRGAAAHFSGRDKIDAKVYIQGKSKKATTNSDVQNTRWQFHTDPERIRAFQDWLKQQMASILVSKTQEELWSKYIEQGFRKGAGRAFDDTRPAVKAAAELNKDKLSFYQGSRDEFLRSAFNQPVAKEKVELLAGRTFDELENVTSDMSNKMSRALTDGLVEGKGPREIARDLNEEVDLGSKRSLVVARTELIRAHAEGQLTALEQLGVEEVGAAIEWSTTGDEKVCELCAPLEGVVLKIDEARGMLPRHPNCRCAWLPANVGEKDDDQKDTKKEIDSALEESGLDDEVAKERPQSIFNTFHDHLAALSHFIVNDGENCGIGPGGFQPGNTCAKGGSDTSEALEAARTRLKYARGMGERAGIQREIRELEAKAKQPTVAPKKEQQVQKIEAVKPSIVPTTVQPPNQLAEALKKGDPKATVAAIKAALPELQHSLIIPPKIKRGREIGGVQILMSTEKSSRGVPTTSPGDRTATGVAFSVSAEDKHIHISEMTSKIKGAGTRMVDAILKSYPGYSVSLLDMSTAGGKAESFWTKMAERHPGRFKL